MIGSGAITASACAAVPWRAPFNPERARDLRPRIRVTPTTALNPPSASSGFRLRIRAVGRHRKIKIGDWRQPWLRVAGALLLVVSACIHLVLYLTGYRSIPTIGWLFLVQFMVAFVLAVGALVTHSRLVAVAGAAFALSTLGCYLLAVWIGLFGFKEIRTRAATETAPTAPTTSETAARMPASIRGLGRAGSSASSSSLITAASASVAKAATSMRPAAIPALVRISLKPNSPIQTASR